MAPPRKWTDTDREVALGLRREGKSYAEVERITGVPTSTLSMWVKTSEAAEAAARATMEGDAPQATEATPPGHESEPPPSYAFRAADTVPRRPSDGRGAPVELDYGEIEKYIASFYKLAAQMAAAQDESLAIAVNAHADEAGQAWAEWIRSEPRVAAMIQKLMIGTPMGKVIGVHVSIVIGYVLARNLRRDVAAGADAGTPAAEPIPA